LIIFIDGSIKVDGFSIQIDGIQCGCSGGTIKLSGKKVSL